MIVTNYQNKSKIKNAHAIEAHKLHDSQHAIIMHLTLQAGESLKPHITPVDVVFYVLEGKPTILIGDEEFVAQEDDLIESPKDIVHCIYNRTDKQARVLVNKLPRPQSATEIIGDKGNEKKNN